MIVFRKIDFSGTIVVRSGSIFNNKMVSIDIPNSSHIARVPSAAATFGLNTIRSCRRGI